MAIQYSFKNMGISKIMLISIFIDEWNIFSIPMISIFVEHSLKFGTSLLGLVTGATVGGASIGSILGGYMVDRFGRKKLLFFNLALFFIFAILSAVSVTSSPGYRRGLPISTTSLALSLPFQEGTEYW